MGKCNRLKEELYIHNMRITYDQPDDFVLHQWQSSSHVDVFYLFYRFLFLATFLVIGIVAVCWTSNLPFEKKIKSAIFFTNWSFVLCVIDALVGLLTVSKAYIKQYMGDPYVIPDFPCLCRSYWIIQNVASELAFCVSIVYWTLVHVTEKNTLGNWNFAFHLWNSSLMLMDFFIVAVPVKILHVYFSMIVGLSYCIFTYVYYSVGGTRADGKQYVYKLVNWKEHPVWAFLRCLSALVFLIFVRIIMFALFRLRVWIYYTYYDEEDCSNNARRRFVL